MIFIYLIDKMFYINLISRSFDLSEPVFLIYFISCPSTHLLLSKLNFYNKFNFTYMAFVVYFLEFQFE